MEAMNNGKYVGKTEEKNIHEININQGSKK